MLLLIAIVLVSALAPFALGFTLLAIVEAMARLGLIR